MSKTLTLTRTFTGLPLVLETDRIVAVDDLVEGPGIFGIARRPGALARDFPVAWISYDAPATDTLPAATISYYALQSGAEVKAALASGVADLHDDPAPFERLKNYLIACKETGIETAPVYAPFGTAEAKPGTWRRGLVEEDLSRLIANLTAGRPLAAETMDDFRAQQGRTQPEIKKLEI